ncbi:MAG: DsbE family thiol:disulfide interchange protein [Nevskia sp.]|nr:DsbE family thiol:disulfide interchange protein [Nevskia sp.]
MRYAIPVVVLLGLLALFINGLQHDPRELPSPLIGKIAPAFSLPMLNGDAKQHVTPDDLKGKPVLVNFFASWCAGCQEEHAYLLQLAGSGQAQIVGIDYKDALDDGRNWLQRRGNPYAQVLVDLDGNTGIDWGVYGVPETFVLDAQGKIIFKHIGPMTPQAWERDVRPKLQAAS